MKLSGTTSFTIWRTGTCISVEQALADQEKILYSGEALISKFSERQVFIRIKYLWNDLCVTYLLNKGRTELDSKDDCF